MKSFLISNKSCTGYTNFFFILNILKMLRLLLKYMNTELQLSEHLHYTLLASSRQVSHIHYNDILHLII